MDKNRQATDIDRKLAIYYHPLFQEIIKNVLLLFHVPNDDVFEIGLLQFIEFNLKLQKSLLPTFEIENALVSALNDWVKQVAECLTYEGMVSTSKCEEITSENFQFLLEKELRGIHINTFTDRQEYMRTLTRMATHDAFKLLGVKINKEVFNKFVFDLCSTWCQFLDIELFTYFLVAIYVQISKGEKLDRSEFRTTEEIRAIDLEFMEEFEQIKAIYSKTRKKDLRYYRAWCQWNYLRINQIGQALILQLDQIHDHDPRILELALIFERAIQVINDQITNQNVIPELAPQPKVQVQEKQGEFLVAKKIEVPMDRQRREDYSHSQQYKKQSVKLEEYQPEDEGLHNFEIEIDAEGNMFLKKIVKLPILGTKIDLQPGERKQALRLLYIEKKREEVRQVSNLYRRMENMKVRLEHNIKNDPYTFKESVRVAERAEFYHRQEAKQKVSQHGGSNPVEKIIHGKMQPEPQPEQTQVSIKGSDYRSNFKPELMEDKEGIRKNQDYTHKVMAPSFVTDQKNNVKFGKKQGDVYGVGPFAEKRDLKMGLPRLKFLEKKFPAPSISTYHIVGKLTKDRAVINDRVKSYSTADQKMTRIEKQRQQYKHVWKRYITQQEMHDLTNYQDFYQKLQNAKKQFSNDYQSQYRLNLKNIDLYDNKRYEMGGVINKEQEERFYERIRKLIKRDNRRQQRRKRKGKLREYRKAVGGKQKRKVFQDIFISYHRSVIKDIKEDRKHYSIAK